MQIIWPVLVLATILRIIYWIQASHHGWFLSPGMDPQYYMVWADAILNGSAEQYIPFPRAPLYPYILAMLRGTFGTSWVVPAVFNLLCDMATIFVIYHLALKIADRRTAIVGSLLYALSGITVYYSGEVLMTSVETMLFALFLLTLFHYSIEKNAGYAVLIGVVLSLFALCRPNGLVLAPASILLMAVIHKDRYIIIIKHGIYFCIAMFLVLSPVIIANWNASGKFIPISTQGGVNFLIGNSPESEGWASILPGYGAAWTDDDARQIAERNAGRVLTADEVSRELWKGGWGRIAIDPAGAVKLILRKVQILINIKELGNNRPLLLAIWAAPQLKFLMFISFGLLLPWAVGGYWLSRKNIEAKVISATALVYAGSLLLFFINSRYRMPLMPVVCLFAGVGLVSIVKWLKNGLMTRWIYSGMSIVLVTGLCYIPVLPIWLNDLEENEAQAHFAAGNAWMRLNRSESALKVFKKAENVDPMYYDLHVNMGVAALESGDTVNAVFAFNQETINNPENAKAYNNLGAIYEMQGLLDSAKYYYEIALELKDNYPEAVINRNRIYLKLVDSFIASQQYPEALEMFEKLIEFNDSSVEVYYRMGVLYLYLNRINQAETALNSALQIDPDFTPARELLDHIEESIGEP